MDERLKKRIAALGVPVEEIDPKSIRYFGEVGMVTGQRNDGKPCSTTPMDVRLQLRAADINLPIVKKALVKEAELNSNVFVGEALVMLSLAAGVRLDPDNAQIWYIDTDAMKKPRK